MATAALDDFMALNDQIAALVQADVPLDLNLGTSKSHTLEALNRINASVARRVGQGMTLAEALEADDPAITPSYRSLMRLSLESGDLSAGVVEAHRSAEASDDVWHSVQLSGVYPLILCCLAYLGLIGFSLLLTPRLDEMYRTLQMTPGLGLRFLQLLQSTLPYWAILFPLAIVLLILWMRYRSRQLAAGGSGAALLAWLPGASYAVFQQQCANFSETLARALDAEAPLPESLRIASGAWDSRSMEEHFRGLAASATPGEPLPEQSWLAARLPPFLRWALWQSEPAIDRPRALHMAAGLYRDSSRRRLSRVRMLAPIIACVLIGGGITLLYGLTLFVPVVELLETLTRPR